MEDRQPTGVVIEMVSGEGASRWQTAVAIPGALATGAFTVATPFENRRPDESRFPRKIGDEPAGLTLYEIAEPDVTGTFERARPSLPEPPDGVTVRRYAFRRYPRPSQGRLTGKPTTGLYVILISPTEPSKAQELRDWADFIHLHYIASATPPGYSMITPYENVGAGDPRFLHLYELDTEDVVTAVDTMPEKVMEHWGFEMGDEAFMRWAMIPSLDIWYVNVFGRTGEPRLGPARERGSGAAPAVGTLDAIHTQRAIRRFEDRLVPDELVTKVLDAAIRAPSPTNAQPWHFVVVRDPDRRKALADIYRRAWEIARTVYGDPEKARDDAERRLLTSTDRMASALDEAPVFIVAALDRTRLGPMVTPDLLTILDPASAFGSVWASIQNLCLAARSLGLAATPTTVFRLFEEDTKKLLNLPAYSDTVALVVLGWPRARFGPTLRRPVSEVAFDEEWGKPLT